VAVRLQTRASSLSAQGVTLSTGEVILGQTLICTIGTEANPLTQQLGLAMQQGRIVTQPDLSVPGHAGLWALGDCAAVPNAHDHSTSPPTAQFAVRQARHLATCLIAQAKGQASTPFKYKSRGMMASIGHLKGVAEVGGMALTGWPAWVVWRAYYLSQMPSFGRRLRVFLEWTWGMFFPPDITHLRFTRSHEQRDDEARRSAEAKPVPERSTGT